MEGFQEMVITINFTLDFNLERQYSFASLL
jgi:hypothetical protein